MTNPPSPGSDAVPQILEDLIRDVQSTFHAFLLAQTTLQLGGGVVESIQDNVVVGVTLGGEMEMEPIPIGELRQYKATFPTFLLEVFHGKTVLHWQGALLKVFRHYVDLHINGKRPFVELRTQEIKFDFKSADSTEEQIRQGLVREFDFWEYAERQKLIDKLRNPNGKYPEHLRNILKHVQVRNAMQHRHGVVDAFALKKLGQTKIEMLDETGCIREFAEGKKVELSIPEYDSFRRSILMVGQAWR